MSHFRTRIRPSVEAELDAARAAEDQGSPALSFARLERAHVLGQASTRLHLRVHGHMLVWGLRRHSAREMFGQVLRLVGAATKTPLGLVPTGNTGGANVSPIRRMAIAPELQRLIDAARSGTIARPLD
ncbi:MAG TPA: DUF3703 domain-containing protein [Burkholderiaceae bacterium]|nr:DUF3703 domain-containing protein [Burkholderiaceae bacterium]